MQIKIKNKELNMNARKNNKLNYNSNKKKYIKYVHMHFYKWASVI